MAADQVTPLVSVVMPTFNGAGIMDDTLTALATQVTGFPWELVCADNGSTDDTLDRLAARADEFPALHVVDASDERGVGHARNVAVARSTGRFLLFIDQDDVPQPGYLGAMAEALESHPLVAARMDGTALNPGARNRILQTDGVPIAFDRFPGASGGSLGIRRVLFDDLDGFDTTVGVSDDIDLCWRAQLLGTGIEFVPDALLLYRFRSSPGSLYRQGVRYGEALSIMKRRYADILRTVERPAKRTHTPLGQLRRLITLRPGAVSETAALLGWYRGMVAARSVSAPPLSPDQFTHLPQYVGKP